MVFLQILLLVNVLYIKGFTSDTDVISKISDVDVQTCIENFDIHKDKIIRTQDSRAMGAKYLNEIDLDSREECLRLCCETENCDVFVYEEKKAGSCYLFQCGPPEDFKCKFAHHVNYTSAVLAVNRHLPDLESQIRLTKHEEDLTKLRSFTFKKPEVKLETTTVTTTTTRKAILKTKTPETKRKCSNYQFECRSTGECIAIYNACDGIPQCADGSDEAPELRCPESTTLTPVVSIKKTPIETKSNAPDDKSRLLPYQTVQQEEVYKAQMMQHPQDFLKPDPLLNPLHSRNYNSHQIPQYQQYMPPQQQQQQPPNWGTRELSPPVYADKNSHIFNHKEVGLQVSDVGEARYNKYKGAMQTLHRALGYGNNAGQLQYADARDYGKIPSYYGSEVYRQPPIPPPNWEKPKPPVYRKESNIPTVYIDEQRPSVEEPKWTQETLKHEQDKMAHELKHSKEHFETEKKKTESHQVHSSSHSHFAVVAEYKTTDEVEDGIVPVPGGALLSLVIGLIVMICLGIMIACRTKAMRARRYSRKGKSYAHDADYLVNGMYL